MNGNIKYEFSTKMWKHSSVGGWYFVSLPKDISKEIRGHLKWQEEGWGRMKAVAQIGTLKWETAIWFDSKRETYLLPVKAEIRAKSNLNMDESIKLILWI